MQALSLWKPGFKSDSVRAQTWKPPDYRSSILGLSNTKLTLASEKWLKIALNWKWKPVLGKNMMKPLSDLIMQ